MDEEEVRIKPAAGIGRDLRMLSVGDLEAYIGELKAEIARVESEIAKRRDVRGAAEALFRRPAGGQPPDR